MVVTPTEAGTGGLGLTIINLAAYFYANYGLVASTQPERLQRVFGILTGLFDWVGLQTNTSKTVGMVCRSCHVPGGMLDEVYARRVTGKGPTFWESQQRRVECPDCGVYVAAGLIMTHCQSQHGMERGKQGGAPQPPPTLQEGPDLPGLLLKTLVATPVPGRGVPGWGVGLD